ncbi:hypothetical protein [Brevundimonas nasdae]|uniref:Uncharacterized protein n=1 Tax=Brevundimonas nasdae TaxID=172043 RepID=A0ABX8TI16_9CAUL|nr:hypothetical protein [Brevundimonas nasdae]QYC10299.1 hypothetical protein KWG56_17425 [Brevundimonas nasdae]QYC13087.1 hypothetical protein KWG63_12745 [Brevundimonas nasdae]
MARLPIDRPLNVARDLSAKIFKDVDINLFDLYEACQAQGMITDRTFIGCRLQGPAILLAAVGVTFDECNLGESGGDVRNLLLKPMGPRALGCVPIRNCSFIGCEFYNVGYTGPQDFLDDLAAVPTTSGPAQ